MLPLCFDRRMFLHAGAVALGAFGVPSLVSASPRNGRARACILLYMDGGPSHIDLWDMKADAPGEVRGPFRPIATSVPGIRVCEHLPRTARQMHRICQVRSVRHNDSVHDPAVYHMLTGRNHVSSAGGLTVQPTDHPHLGAAFASLDRTPAAMPKSIELPETMRMEARVLPGQNAGFLGVARDPFRVTVTPSGEVLPPEFERRVDVPSARLERRSALLRQLESSRGAGPQSELFDICRRQAIALLHQPDVRRAFDLDREPAQVRDAYGRHRHGQSVLLARRLVEAGSRFVTVYWGKEDQDWADGRGPRPANNPWDTHRNHFPLVRDELVPRADQTLAALLADLADRGLLQETLVVWMGDFGRTPRIDRRWASRDHWPHANTVLFAGAGTPGGAVIGRTDSLAAEVTDEPVSPADICATVLAKLGISPTSPLRDAEGRMIPAAEGSPIRGIG